MSWGIGHTVRSVKSPQLKVEKLYCQIDGSAVTSTPNVSTGLITGGQDFYVLDNGTGDYQLTFKKDIPARILGVQVTPIADAGDLVASVDATFSPSAGVQILLWDGTDGTTAKDGDCFVEVTVSYSSDEI